MKTGRNDPCPCGSGRKYKKCCLSPSVSSFPKGMSPTELIRARVRAFMDGDFGLIYDSYHSQSYFLKQFPDREAYIRYGRSTLAGDFSILQCRVLLEQFRGDEGRVIFYLETSHAGVRSESLELALFYPEEGQWRYHSSQKMDREEFDGEIDEIDWSDFDKVKDKVFF